MTTIQEISAEPPAGRIGSTPHGIRNTLVALGLIALTALLALLYWPGAGADSHVSGELSQFRVAMFNRCGGQQFDGVVNPRLAQTYAENERMRVMVIKQFHQLQLTAASCDDVRAALQSVDYPVQ